MIRQKSADGMQINQKQFKNRSPSQLMRNHPKLAKMSKVLIQNRKLIAEPSISDAIS